MTTPVIVTLCILLLLAYVFDISSAKTRVPSVILLLFLGWLVRQGSNFFGATIPDLGPLLPMLGTIGLILIVLEGSLELELNRSKFKLVGKTAIIAILPILLLSFGVAFALQYFEQVPLKIGLANAIPLSIISSAIAIPTVRSLPQHEREFVTYESSLSDIFGVIFFNFIVLNSTIGTGSIGKFLLEMLLLLVITFVFTAALALLLSRIRHHVKFVPIMLMLILIYVIAKHYHLPALLFILLFGLFMGNLDELKGNRFIQKLKPELLDKEVHRFRELTREIVFLIRSLFFLLFGYLIETHDVINPSTLVWAIGIVAGILVIRYIFLKILGLPGTPLLYIAPRGLITILLFLSIPATQAIPLFNRSLVLQVIIIMAFVMMIGMIKQKPSEQTEEPESPDLDVIQEI